MGALYWYTIVFGSVKEDGIIKPYGYYLYQLVRVLPVVLVNVNTIGVIRLNLQN